MYSLFMERDEITPIGITNYRNTNRKFGIKDQDRLLHIYIIGKSGTGKSTLLENMAISDIKRGNGLCIIDPHGDIAEDVLKYIPEERKQDLIYFDATDQKKPIAFNPLKGIHPKYHHLVTSGIVSTFKKIWSESWGPRMEYILRYTLLTLLHYQVYKSDKDIPKYIKMHIDHGLDLINGEIKRSPSLDGFDFIANKIEAGLKHIE